MELETAPRTTQPQQVSTLGNISMALAMLALIMFCGGLAGIVALPSNVDAAPDIPFYKTAEPYVWVSCFSLPLALFGAIAGAVAAFHPERSKVLPIAGLLINAALLAMVLLACAGIMILVMLAV